MKLRKALWLWFAFLVVHNLEELATMAAFLRQQAGRMPAALAPILGGLTAGQFSVSLAVVTVGAFAVTWFAARDLRAGSTWPAVAGGVYALMAVNALQHTGTAIWAGGYAPGVVTALVLILPASVYLLRRLLREGYAGAHSLALWAMLFVVAEVPVLLGLHTLGRLFIQNS